MKPRTAANQGTIVNRRTNRPMCARESVARRERALQMLQGGMRQADIARALGVSTAAVSRWVHQDNPRQVEQCERERRALELWRRGWGAQDIAREVNLKPSGVKALLHRCRKREHLEGPQPAPAPELLPSADAQPPQLTDARARRLARKRRLAELWDQGFTQTEIARALGVSDAAISTRIKRALAADELAPRPRSFCRHSREVSR